VEAFLGEGDPPIAFTPGSANQFGRRFFAAAVDACRRLKCRGLLLTPFAEQLPAELPPTLLHVPYAPFSRLLPRCRAFVHHGGVGSMSQAMSAGIPQVIVALAHDQFDNARRVRRLGVGVSIERLPVSGRRLARRLSRLIASPSVTERCREIAARLSHEHGLDDLAAALVARAADSTSQGSHSVFDTGRTRG
jgi:rhamnosyltransferase subunit B